MIRLPGLLQNPLDLQAQANQNATATTGAGRGRPATANGQQATNNMVPPPAPPIASQVAPTTTGQKGFGNTPTSGATSSKTASFLQFARLMGILAAR